MDSRDNPEASGVVMVHRIQKETGVKLDIKYPDCEAIISYIKRKTDGRGRSESQGPMEQAARSSGLVDC